VSYDQPHHPTPTLFPYTTLFRSYLAEEKKHGRKVAIKVLRPEITAALGTDRFLREIGIAAQLSHPHIVPLIDSGEAAGLLYYVRSEEHTSELQSRSDLVCRLLLE